MSSQVTRRQFVTLGGSALLASALLAACSSSASQATASKGGAQSTNAPAVPTAAPTPIRATAGKGATVVNLWSGLTGPDGVGVVQLLQGYAKDHPEVSIQIQWMPWSTLWDKATASFVAGNPPQLFIPGVREGYPYIAQKLLYPLDDLVKGTVVPGQSLPLSDFGPTLPGCYFEGKLYGIPYAIYTWALLFNKDLVKAAGLDPDKPPTTLEEYRDWGIKTTLDSSGRHPGDSGFDSKNVKQWGMVYNNQYDIWQTMIVEQGGEQMIPAMDATKVNSDTPEAIKALEEMVSWSTKLQIGAPLSNSAGDPTVGFWAGKVAMLYDGVWICNAIKANPKIPTGVAVTPQWYGSQPKVTCSGFDMTMPATIKDKQLEETWKIIVFMSNNEWAYVVNGQTPSRKSLMESKKFKDLWPENVFGSQVPTGVEYTPHPKIIELEDLINSAINAALGGAKSPSDALKEAQQQEQAVLMRWKKTET